MLEENICGGTAKIVRKKNNFKKFHKHFLDSSINCVPLDSHNGSLLIQNRRERLNKAACAFVVVVFVAMYAI